MQQDVLNVFLNESQVGTLLQENGALSFKYAPEYLQNKEAYPLSQMEYSMIRWLRTSFPIFCQMNVSGRLLQ